MGRWLGRERYGQEGKDTERAKKNIIGQLASTRISEGSKSLEEKRICTAAHPHTSRAPGRNVVERVLGAKGTDGMYSFYDACATMMLHTCKIQPVLPAGVSGSQSRCAKPPPEDWKVCNVTLYSRKDLDDNRRSLHHDVPGCR